MIGASFSPFQTYLQINRSLSFGYFSEEVLSLNSVYPFLTFYPPIFLSLAISPLLLPVAAYFFVEEYAIARAVSCELAVSTERQRLRFRSTFDPSAYLCPFVLSIAPFKKHQQSVAVSLTVDSVG